MKIAGCMMILISTTLTGFYLSSVLRKRAKLFEELALFSENLSSAIRYNACDIYSIIETERKNLKIPLTDKVAENLEKGFDVAESFEKALEEVSSVYGLSKEEKEIIRQFGNKIGITDVDGQISHCEYFKRIFSEKAELLRKESAVKSKLYHSLGFFGGLALAVLFI